VRDRSRISAAKLAAVLDVSIVLAWAHPFGRRSDLRPGV
jgi:hypothetical protein